MLKNRRLRACVWVGLLVALAAAALTYVQAPAVPVRALAWMLIWFAWMKVMVLLDLRWQRRHAPDAYAALQASHGGPGALRAWVIYRVLAILALSSGAVVCWVLNWSSPPA